MKKLVALNILTITVTIFFYIANYLLLRDNSHISISSIITEANQLHGQSHVLVLALLPIYVATMIFGASLLGIYLGSYMQNLFLRHVKSK